MESLLAVVQPLIASLHWFTDRHRRRFAGGEDRAPQGTRHRPHGNALVRLEGGGAADGLAAPAVECVLRLDPGDMLINGRAIIDVFIAN